MAKIGDSFPESLSEMLASHNLSLGSVLKIHVKDTKPPKTKRFIIVGICPDKISVASIYINSKLNVRVFNTKELRDLTITLSADKREYLDRQSVVDCSFIHEKSYDNLLKSLKQSPTINIGTVNEIDMELILNKIKTAKTISPALSKKYNF